MINLYIVDYFNIGRANGLSTYVSALTKGITSFKFQVDGGYLKIAGECASGADILLNAKEILTGDQTWAEDLEYLGQFTLGIIGLGAEAIGVGFAIDAGLAAWETAEAAGWTVN